ncbi:MAG: hypothetical protein EOP53_24945 [Sphingobacteriales bacterium]|nr:MAG: hypothetical protein EOP53_24945 [Sphingobacteriales bacterium]
MADIMHQATINTSAKQIYPLIATKEGLQKWLKPEDGWKIQGAENLGGILRFYLHENFHEMKVIILEKDSHVRWECITGPEEWLGTTVDFFIEDNVKKCTLQFAHNGWAEQSKFFQECDQAWGTFVVEIKKQAEA